MVESRVARNCVCCGGAHIRKSPAILMPFISDRALGWKPVVIDDSWGLSSIPTGNAYSICNSLMCIDCGHLFLDIRFSEDEMSNLYRDYRGKEYAELREFYEPGYTLRNVDLEGGHTYNHLVELFLEPYLKLPVSILDWGGDTGINTPYRRSATEFDIYDLSNKNLIHGARRVNKEQAYSKIYDLIVCSNVLEHVPYPSVLINEMINTMSDKSVMYIEVPFEELVRIHGDCSLPFKKHWHEHINFFSEFSMMSLLENCGLSVIKISSDSIITAGLKESYIMQVACRIKQ